ncbi:MAG: elongation factor G [Chloroflexi bacterium]|nr:MAG: elongation factor G [Chloroflexota bacterium]
MATELAHIRNIGMIAHIDAGKTTTTERMLYYSGYTHALGDVDDGTTVTDWWEQERERGITIKAASITTRWRDAVTGEEAQINIIDTPGHIDFTAEVQRSLRVLDGGVVIFDAVNGVEPQSETVWRQADTYHVPRLCYINKMDRTGADLPRTLAMIRERLHAQPVLLQLPIGVESQFSGVVDLITQQALLFSDELGAHPELRPIPTEMAATANAAREELVEKIAECDDDLTNKYLAGVLIENDELYWVLRRAVISNQLTPVLLGSSLHNKGVQPLLDAIVRYLPSPLDLPSVEGVDPTSGCTVTRQARVDEPLCGLVFKIVMDPYAGRLAYTRLYSGVLRAGSAIYNATRRRRERAQRLLQVQAKKYNEIPECRAGDIVAIVGFKESTTGDTLSDPTHEILLEPITFPEPVIRVAVEPHDAVEQGKLADALTNLSEEDPTFRYMIDEQTGQMIISGMGELHLEIIADRLLRDYGVRCRMGAPQVAYRETVTRPAQAEGSHAREMGGRRHFAVVHLEVAPNATNAGFTFVDRTTAETFPRPYVAAAQRGVMSALQSGVLLGYPVIDVRVTLLSAQHHAADSSAEDFEVAGQLACREAMRQAGPVLLEPVMRVETYAPEAYAGSVVHDFGARRGVVQAVTVSGNDMRAVTALTPLTGMIGYATDLRSLTSGRGAFTMELDHYAPVSEATHERLLGPNWRSLFA